MFSKVNAERQILYVFTHMQNTNLKKPTIIWHDCERVTMVCGGRLVGGWREKGEGDGGVNMIEVYIYIWKNIMKPTANLKVGNESNRRVEFDLSTLYACMEISQW
jgi:hypothetical protein